MEKSENNKQLREESLGWFFGIQSDDEKKFLKNKHFPDTHIAYDSHWGYHFTFGQIEEMFIKEVKTKP